MFCAVDGISGDPLASVPIGQETSADYRRLASAMRDAGYPVPLFAAIDGRSGAENAVRTVWDIPVQTCQAHKIATADRYLLKYPRRESYRVLKRIAHEMAVTDEATFRWLLDEFRKVFGDDLEMKIPDRKTGRGRYAHPRLRRAYRSLVRDLDKLFVCHRFLRETGGKEINTTNRIECVFSHAKPKTGVHRGIGKEKKLSLALSFFW